MGKTARIEASNEEEAVKKARKKLEAELDMKLETEQLEAELVEEKKKLFGLKKKKIYEVTLKDEKILSETEEGFLDIAVETISIDGKFSIKIDDDGIFLKVKPAQGEGKDVRYPKIKSALEEKEIVEVDWQAVQEILGAKENEWGLIAPRKPELDRDGEIQVEISDDKLKAFINYVPALGGSKLSQEDVKNILNEQGITYGIKKNKIKKILEDGNSVDSVLIAEGDPPEAGEDAQLVYHVEEKSDSTGTKREDGSIDFYNLGLILNVQPGDVLVTKKDSIPGQPGKAVTGEEVSAPEPEDKKLPRGKNARQKDEHTVVADIAGQVVFEENRVNVLPIYEENGDVDLSTGNIDFVGNVCIRGDITEGFVVKAEGNVEVFGHVSIGDIKAGGDVLIHKGFVGKHKAKITAGGSVKVKFVENAEIKAGENIEVTDAVMHSKLTAGNSIDITTSKGLLVGGTTKARKKIEANIIGSNLATTTQLEVGIDPELKAKIKQLDEEIKEAKNNLLKTTKALKILEKLKKHNDGFPEEKVVMYYQLQETREDLNNNIDDKQAKLMDLESKLDIVEQGYIVAKRKIYPGVKIIIGKSQLNVHNHMNKSKFVEEDGEVKQLV